MAFTYIWNKLHLHRKKIVFAVFSVLFLSSSLASAQKKISQENKPNYDEKKVHYGFYLAVPLTKYNLEHSQEYVDQLNSGSAMTVNARTSPGFYTGLVLNVGLAEYLDFRFVPGVGFYGRTIEFGNAAQDDGSRGTTNVTISSTMVELPFLLKYKSKRRTNYRMYFVGGVKPGIDLNSEKDSNNGDGLRTEKFDLALEYGVGLDIFYPFFKFAPELRFSHGLLNQHVRDNNMYSRSIQRLTNHNISLILFFE
ncbi:PorT family protein [Pontibacter qinzhouensis]|uniref:PorT family protein n=1 Tax=Pontibacter qinzhouensis TaxID=2603253 RepID=A0A5C8KA18_9BACT|nr:porin family protein [Pontibacter qinzhouensis]TXK48046.1 PorT family protein [Pontibacter qinzhouensis]